MGLIVLPGGGYEGLSEHEGKGYAEYFSKAGIACFVVSYRLASNGFRHPAMLEDALAAIDAVRCNARAYGVDPGHVGIMGSSAGGHLAAHTLVAWSHYESDVSLRPDFGILCYPVITSQGPYPKGGHGLGLNTPFDWGSECLRWMNDIAQHPSACDVLKAAHEE